MKKIVFLLFLFPAIAVKANITFPGAKIFEVYFESPDSWALDFFIFESTEFFLYEEIDSIKLETKHGIATVTHFDTTYLCVITNSNLSNPITIDKDNDLIMLRSYFWGDVYTDYLAVGSHPYSYLKNIQYGQSVARAYIEGPFYISNCPSIGYNNNLSCTKGVIKGNINIFNVVVGGQRFYIPEGYSGLVYIDKGGYYSAQLTSRSYELSSIDIFGSQGQYYHVLIQPVNFEINQNDTLNIDFIGIDTFVPQNRYNKKFISNHPNPANDYTTFILSSSIDITQQLYLSIYNTLGKVMDRIPVDSHEVYYSCNNLPPGTYVSVLSRDREIIASKKFHVLR